MNKISIALIITCLSACAAQQESNTHDMEQAIRDFIAVRQLSEVDKMRTANHEHWTELDPNFIVYTARRKAFLIEFTRACHELSDTQVVADVRRERNTIRARFDTFRGCRIHKIFALSEGEVAELKTLGELPGSRN